MHFKPTRKLTSHRQPEKSPAEQWLSFSSAYVQSVAWNWLQKYSLSKNPGEMKSSTSSTWQHVDRQFCTVHIPQRLCRTFKGAVSIYSPADLCTDSKQCDNHLVIIAFICFQFPMARPVGIVNGQSKTVYRL